MQHKTPIVVYESLHLEEVVGPEPLLDAAWLNRLEAEKNTCDMDLKRRWGMGGTKPIESGVKAMPLRSAVESTVSGRIGVDSFDTNPMKADIGQKNIDKKATTSLTTTASAAGSESAEGAKLQMCRPPMPQILKIVGGNA
jgi:hypothetical protein